MHFIYRSDIPTIYNFSKYQILVIFYCEYLRQNSEKKLLDFNSCRKRNIVKSDIAFDDGNNNLRKNLIIFQIYRL